MGFSYYEIMLYFYLNLLVFLLHIIQEIKLCLLPQLLLNPQQPVVFGSPLASCRSSKLALARANTNNQICNKAVFCFSASVAHNNIPFVFEREVCSINRFCYCSNLINFEK